MTANPTIQQEVAEALCAALYQTNFEPLAETEGPDGLTSWFTRGEFPKKIRVSVRRSVFDAVIVKVEWHNVSVPSTPLKCQQDMTVTTLAATRVDLNSATTNVITRVLEIFKDVLEGKGVAGPISQLAPEGVDSET